jgi:twinkle protein
MKRAGLPWSKTAGKVLVRPGKLAIWAGYTHHGKTQMVKQLMLHAIGQSEKALVASMEEEVLDVWKDMARLACANQEPITEGD